MHRRIHAPAAALAAAALLLGGCGGTDPATPEGAAASTSAGPVAAIDPDAPELTERGRVHNMLADDDDGMTAVVARVRVAYAEGWTGLVDDPAAPATLDEGVYEVRALASRACPGAGAEAPEGLGAVGEVHADGAGSAQVWSTPLEQDPDAVAQLILVDDEDEVAGCGKAVDWTPPAEPDGEAADGS